MVYSNFINQKQRPPTAQTNFEEKIGRSDIEWSEVYSKIYRSTIDVRLRAFQYKIVNNCLFLNNKLFQFKKIESPLCSLCLEELESISHFFVECKVSKRYYSECQSWLANANIALPSHNIEHVLLGINTSIFEYFLLLVWKHTLYEARIKQTLPVLIDFQSAIRHYEKIEYIIAQKRSKLILHLKKYELIKGIL